MPYFVECLLNIKKYRWVVFFIFEGLADIVSFGGFALLWNVASKNRIDDLAGFSDPLGVEGVDSLATFRIILQEVFASCCDKSAAPLGIFGVIVSSSYESIA